MPDSGTIKFEGKKFFRDTSVGKKYCYGLSAIH